MATRNSRVSKQINILLLGQTGTGKSTFINSIVNHLTHPTLNDAIQGALHCIIPAVFYHTDENNEYVSIPVGIPDPNENIDSIGESRTRGCRTYVIKIGDVELRLIDVPGVGDTGGIEQDTKNFQSLLNHISQYTHLNGICLFLQATRDKLDISYRYCIKELLTYLAKSAAKNIIFVFTHTRARFFKPGEAAVTLKKFLKGLKDDDNIDVPFHQDNTFCFDNESFMFLAKYKSPVSFEEDEIDQINKSWINSEKKYVKLIEWILQCEPHQVHETVSLNEAKQLVNKLHRAIAETTRLIEENMQLAAQYRDEDHSDSLSDCDESTDEQQILLPQHEAERIELGFPRTVCTSETCTDIINLNGVLQVHYNMHCHDHCYLNHVSHEVIGHPKLRGCQAMDSASGQCNECGCNWSKHQHITYEYHRRLIEIPLTMNINEISTTRTSSSSIKSSSTQRPSSPNEICYESQRETINRHIKMLQDEKKEMLAEYTKLSQFLHLHALMPYNDDIIGYLKLFIEQEKRKQNLSSNNVSVMEGLQATMEKYQQEMEHFKKVIRSNTTGSTNSSSQQNQNLDLSDIRTALERLYRLPINGQKIRDQIEGSKRQQSRNDPKNEKTIKLPISVKQSDVLLALTKLFI